MLTKWLRAMFNGKIRLLLFAGAELIFEHVEEKKKKKKKKKKEKKKKETKKKEEERRKKEKKHKAYSH